MTLDDISKLSDDELRVKVAELVGLIVIECPFIPGKVQLTDKTVFTKEAAREWRKVYPNGVIVQYCPNFARDLNAMHEAEGTLTNKEYDTYCNTLTALASAQHSARILKERAFLSATARQRAIAFIATKEGVR